VALPQPTINVADASALGGNFGPSASCVLKVTTSAGIQTVTCTTLTGNQFSGCSGGTGTMTAGAAISRASDYLGTQQSGTGPIITTIASGSGGVTLPQATIQISSTAFFPPSGSLKIGAATITYTGKTATAFTGASGGIGSLATGQQVLGIGQDPRYPNEPWGRVPVVHWRNRTHGTFYNQVALVNQWMVDNRDSFNYGSSDKPADTGTWVDSYVEYTYPHPLQSGAPAAPTALRIQL